MKADRRISARIFGFSLISGLCLVFGLQSCEDGGSPFLLHDHDHGNYSNDTGITYANFVGNLFLSRCGGTACHTGSAPIRNFAVDTYDHVLAGGVSGAAIVPGNPTQSLAYMYLFADSGWAPRMPEGGPYLAQSTIDSIRQWILSGAPRGDTGGAVIPTPSPLTWSGYVAPLLAGACGGSSCHTGSNPEKNLSVASYALARTGGVSGPGITPNDTTRSTVFESLFKDNGIIDQMPRDALPLRASAIDSLRQWILAGAPES